MNWYLRQTKQTLTMVTLW